MNQPADILKFWFRPGMEKNWFERNDTIDREIRVNFSETCEAAAAGKLAHWQRDPEGALALTIALDQFPRNLYRNDARAFANDEAARAVAGWAVQREFDRRLDHPDKRMFLYMPFIHSEDLAHQRLGVDLFKQGGCHEKAIESAQEHMKIIERFGRFPHRNAVLGRESTEEESRFLEEHDGF